MNDDDLVREQLDYYRARAPEFEDWFYRRGRYHRGEQANAQWLRDIATVEQSLAAQAPFRSVVELAAGTGLWTRWLAAVSEHVTAVDGSDEMLTINRAQTRAANVTYVRADLFDWHPPRQFDHVFMGFWLSHVPLERLDAFWSLVEELLGGQGTLFFVDSLYNEAVTAADDALEGPAATSLTRRLNDGRQFRIVKVFHGPEELQQRLEARGWSARVWAAGDNFVYGHATLTPDVSR